MSTIQKVLKWAPRLEWLTTAAMVLLPIAVVVGLFFSAPITQTLSANANVYVDTSSLTGFQVTASVALNLISPLILMIILWTMRGLFQSYRRGEILTADCADRIKRIGQGFLALALVPFLLVPIQTALLTLNNPAGQRAISVGLSSEMLLFALSGCWTIVIGWAMRDASDVATENRAFV